MARKKTEKPKVVGQIKAGSPIRYVQIQVPAAAYEQGKRIAKANGLSWAAYVRQALLKQIRADVQEMKGGPK
jgi:hypothetical protein